MTTMVEECAEETGTLVEEVEDEEEDSDDSLTAETADVAFEERDGNGDGRDCSFFFNFKQSART